MEPQFPYRRVTITLPLDVAESLASVAKDHYRDPRREALHLLTGAVRREARCLARADVGAGPPEP